VSEQSNKSARVALRIEPELRERLERAAEADRRTLADLCRLVLEVGVEAWECDRPDGRTAA
jgi:uncharacterized protein (DUF1778 family)